jgi:hypothetical protein
MMRSANGMSVWKERSPHVIRVWLWHVALETTNRNAEIPSGELDGANPFDYLTELQRQSEELKPKPPEMDALELPRKDGRCHRSLITGFVPGGKKDGQAGGSTQNGGKRPFVWQRADLSRGENRALRGAEGCRESVFSCWHGEGPEATEILTMKSGYNRQEMQAYRSRDCQPVAEDNR